MERSGAFLAILFLLALSSPVSAQQGTIRGKVRAPSGATLTGVIIELWRSNGRIGQAVTTGDGDFYFADLIPDIYEVVVHHVGYQPVSERAEFRFPANSGQREVVTIVINLKPVATETATTAPATSFVQEVPPAAREAFEKGVARIKEGKSSEGVNFLQEAIKLFPDYFHAHFALGTELSKQNQPQAALQSLERARQINDRDARVYHLFGILMARQRKFIVAEYAFREAIERDPTSAPSRFSHAIALIEMASKEDNQLRRSLHLAEAERDLMKALDLSDKKLVNAYLQLARIYELRGERKLAAQTLATYLKLQPDDKNAPAIREAIAKLSGQ
jgi:Tfp pilus assembly protein PilF